MPGTRRTAALLAAALLLTGCAGVSDVGLPSASGSTWGERWTGCPRDALPDPSVHRPTRPPPPAADEPRWSPGAPVREVVVCDSHEQRQPDGSRWTVLRERRGTDVAALLAALALPYEVTLGGACAAVGRRTTWFALVESGGLWLRPPVPTDPCGQDHGEVQRALDATSLRTVAVTPVRQLTAPSRSRSRSRPPS